MVKQFSVDFEVSNIYRAGETRSSLLNESTDTHHPALAASLLFKCPLQALYEHGVVSRHTAWLGYSLRVQMPLVELGGLAPLALTACTMNW